MPRERRRRRRDSGRSGHNPAIYANIHSSVWEAVSGFQGKMIGMRDNFRTGAAQGASAGEDIQKAVMEMVEGIMSGVKSSIPQLKQD